MSATINFGKHNGKTLVEIVFSDPAWFRWAVGDRIFFDRGGLRLQSEAQQLWRKARNMRIPRDKPEEWRAAYYYQWQNHKFTDVRIVPKGQIEDYAEIGSVLDLGHVCQSGRDVTGNNLLVKAIKRILFGKGTRVTKQRLEQFFDDPANFDLPVPLQQAAE